MAGRHYEPPGGGAQLRRVARSCRAFASRAGGRHGSRDRAARGRAPCRQGAHHHPARPRRARDAALDRRRENDGPHARLRHRSRARAGRAGGDADRGARDGTLSRDGTPRGAGRGQEASRAHARLSRGPSRVRGAAALRGAFASALLAAPGAHAHGFGQRYDLPIPLSLYVTGAALTVAVSCVMLAFLVRAPSQGLGEARFRVLTESQASTFAVRVALALVRSVAVALYLLVVIAGF